MKAQHDVHALARWQWIGMNGAPQSQLFTYAAKLQKINSGIGLVYEHEYIGVSELNLAKLNYAYHLKLNENHHLSLGLAAGMNSIAYSKEWSHQDTSASKNELNIGFTSDLGVFYSFKKFDAGFSITQLIDSKNTPSYSESQHFYFYAGYTFGKDEGFQIRPQLFFRSNQGYNSIDLNAMMSYQSKYFLGLTYRNRDAYGITGGYTLKDRYNLSYTYEVTVSKLNNGFSGGSHEIHLGFRLKDTH
jgi:type IX secretion system PorP/SprF family membrane protein